MGIATADMKPVNGRSAVEVRTHEPTAEHSPRLQQLHTFKLPPYEDEYQGGCGWGQLEILLAVTADKAGPPSRARVAAAGITVHSEHPTVASLLPSGMRKRRAPSERGSWGTDGAMGPQIAL